MAKERWTVVMLVEYPDCQASVLASVLAETSIAAAARARSAVETPVIRPKVVAVFYGAHNDQLRHAAPATHRGLVFVDPYEPTEGVAA